MLGLARCGVCGVVFKTEVCEAFVAPGVASHLTINVTALGLARRGVVLKILVGVVRHWGYRTAVEL